ncbi:MAG: RluA family pseudouridine synthase [Vicinamibacterales bacterium]
MAGDQWIVGPSETGLRLDKFLAAPNRLDSRGRAGAAIEKGQVYLNDVEMASTDGARRLVAGDAVRVWRDRPGSARRAPRAETGDLGIVFEDSALIVLNKPAGLLSVPLERKAGASSVYDQLEEYFRSQGKRKPFVVHRIDRDTSGLVLFARDARTQAALKAQFRRREPERVYWAVVYGHPDPARGTWRDHLVWDTKALIQKETSPRDPQGTEAVCEYVVLERFHETSLVEVRLHTGKRNQIRIQARLRGHTLVGERRYAFGPDTLRPIAFARQALHAHRLAFRHPEDGRLLRFEAPPPADLAALIARLRA